MDHYVKKFVKNHPGFVNKYSSRSNGGIPCFSQERLLERAAKVSLKFSLTSDIKRSSVEAL